MFGKVLSWVDMVYNIKGQVKQSSTPNIKVVIAEGPAAAVTVGAPMFKRYLMAMETYWLLFVEDKKEWFDVNVGVQLIH